MTKSQIDRPGQPIKYLTERRASPCIPFRKLKTLYLVGRESGKGGDYFSKQVIG